MIVDPKEITVVGETNFRNMRKKFGIKRDDRRRHVYVIGKSGSGKSALLENMIMQDIINGNGCCVMDPHGDLAEAIVRCVPPERQGDIVYFNPSDTEHPIAFNILEGAESDSSKNLVTSGLIGIFKKIWADSWGPRLEYVLRNTILSLMYSGGSTLLGINRMLVDKKYRNSVLEKVSDPIIKAFWTQEYENYPAKELPTIISPIQNKVGQFLSNPIVRNILGQPHSTLDLREIMDKKKIFLVNLSKGRIGEDNSSLIGSMLVTKLYLAAMSRVDTPENERNDFYLYVDEFQNFATDSFADILSEARKYRLSLIIAHQYVLQLPEKVSDAIFGNGGTLITFRLGPQDAEIFEKEFGPDFTLEDLVNIPKYNVVLKLLIDGVTSKPFSAATLPPVTKNSTYEDRSSIIIAESRKRYARPRDVVEAQIRDWSMSEDEKRALEKREKEERQKKEKEENGEQSQDKKQTHTATCWVCGMKMEVPFQPDDKRPIYCTDDLKKIREGLIEEPKENRFKSSNSKNTNIKQEKENKNTNNSKDVSKQQNPQNNSNNNQKNSGQKQPENQHNQSNKNNNQQQQKQNQGNNRNNQQQKSTQSQNQNDKKPNNTISTPIEKSKIIENKVVNSIDPIKKNELIEPEKNEKLIEQEKEEILIKQEEEEVLLEPTKENALLEPKQEIQKIEEPVIKQDTQIDFKSIFEDIARETGINIENQKPKTQPTPIEIKETTTVTKGDIQEEKNEIEEGNIQTQKQSEPIDNIAENTATKTQDNTVNIVENKNVLNLNQLKEKSFEELNQTLSNNIQKSNQPNVLKAGEVIKL